MTGLFSKELIETAAERAVKEVPQKLLNRLRERKPDLELQIEGEIPEEIEGLSGDYRYNFVLTPHKGEVQICCGFPKKEVQPSFIKTFQKYGPLRAEIWQGESEASLEKLKRSYW